MQLKFLSYLTVIVVLGLSAALNISASDENQHGSTPLFGLQYWNDIDKQAIETESGLKYKILISGKGRKPKARSNVTVHYRGLLLDGREFDSTYDQDEPVKFNLGKVIEGWSEGIQLMPAGSVYVFLIPPELAYGEQGIGDIAPNATLIFEIELFKRK